MKMKMDITQNPPMKPTLSSEPVLALPMQGKEPPRCQAEYLPHVRNLKEFFHHHARTETDQHLIYLLHLHQNQFTNEHSLHHLLHDLHHNTSQGHHLQPFPNIHSLLKLNGSE